MTTAAEIEGIDVRMVSNAYTSDPDYNEFLGTSKRVVRYDWTIRQYRWMVISEPKSPADRVPVGDPNAVIADEGTDEDGNPRKAMGMQAKTEAALAQIRELLKEKRLSTVELAAALGMTNHRLKAIMLNHPEDFDIVARSRQGHVYALKGQVYAEPYLAKSMPRIAAYLKERGPLHINGLVLALKMPPCVIFDSMAANPGVMVVVGQKESRRRMIDIWGLAGIHDQKDAA